MSSKLFVTCVAVTVVSLAVGFFFGRASNPNQVVTRLVPASRDSRVLTDSRAREVVLTESGSSRVALSGPVPPTVAEPKEPSVEEAIASFDRALRNRPIGDGSDAEFERKYRGVSLAAAREAMLLLAAQAEEEQAAVIKLRMAQGQFEERRPHDGQDPPHVRGTGPGPSTLSMTQAIDADGVVVSRVTTFDSQDYPSLYATQREVLYLQGMMRVPFKPVVRTPK